VQTCGLAPYILTLFHSLRDYGALAEKRMYDAAGACGLVADPSREIALSPRSARPADPRTGLIVSHQRWDTTQAVSGCGGGSSWDVRWRSGVSVSETLENPSRRAKNRPQSRLTGNQPPVALPKMCRKSLSA
jgi:hypothetical protein